MHIESHKLEFKEKAKPKIGSLEKSTHAPGGGNVKIEQNKLHFKGLCISALCIVHMCIVCISTCFRDG